MRRANFSRNDFFGANAVVVVAVAVLPVDVVDDVDVEPPLDDNKAGVVELIAIDAATAATLNDVVDDDGVKPGRSTFNAATRSGRPLFFASDN